MQAETLPLNPLRRSFPSPNHGLFRKDGLYSESNTVLESPPTVGPLRAGVNTCLTGAIIECVTRRRGGGGGERARRRGDNDRGC